MEDSFVEKLVNLFKDNVISFVAIAVGILVLVVGLVLYFSESKGTIEFAEAEDELIEDTSSDLYVDVSGGVVSPGIYKLDVSARVSDAIDIAVGFSEEADSNATQKIINLAKPLTDGEKVYVPIKRTEQAGVPADTQTSTSDSGLININSATSSLLETLPGIGPVTAGEIIDGRPYSSVDELFDRKIVGQKTYEKIKTSISVF